jgi:hypothetical protein
MFNDKFVLELPIDGVRCAMAGFQISDAMYMDMI